MELASVLAALAVVLDLAIAAVLMWKYKRTRDTGLLWLALAIGIWPLFSRLLTFGVRLLIDKVARHQPVGFYPFNLVGEGQITLGQLVTYIAAAEQIVGICLLLVAVFYLARTNIRRTA
jgi:hypothetical protein